MGSATVFVFCVQYIFRGRVYIIGVCVGISVPGRGLDGDLKCWLEVGFVWVCSRLIVYNRGIRSTYRWGGGRGSSGSGRDDSV